MEVYARSYSAMQLIRTIAKLLDQRYFVLSSNVDNVVIRITIRYFAIVLVAFNFFYYPHSTQTARG